MVEIRWLAYFIAILWSAIIGAGLWRAVTIYQSTRQIIWLVRLGMGVMLLIGIPLWLAGVRQGEYLIWIVALVALVVDIGKLGFKRLINQR